MIEYPCAFQGVCWKNIPSPSVFDLPGFHKKAWSLHKDGIVRLDDPRIEPFKGTRLHQAQAAITGIRWVDAESMREKLAAWAWPLHFLDFETINYAIPRIAGTRPYEQIPFQFSCDVVNKSGDASRHHEFLHGDGTDPRPRLVAALLAAIGPKGNVVAYNAKFEATIIADLAKRFPDQASALNSIVERMVDPLPVFRAAVYDRAFEGSFSLKAVAPAILGERASYVDLEVGDGGAAQRAFVNMIADSTPPADRERLRVALLAYCGQDTLVMVDLVKWLYEKASTQSK